MEQPGQGSLPLPPCCAVLGPPAGHLWAALPQGPGFLAVNLPASGCWVGAPDPWGVGWELAREWEPSVGPCLNWSCVCSVSCNPCTPGTASFLHGFGFGAWVVASWEAGAKGLPTGQEEGAEAGLRGQPGGDRAGAPSAVTARRLEGGSWHRPLAVVMRSLGTRGVRGDPGHLAPCRPCAPPGGGLSCRQSGALSQPRSQWPWKGPGLRGGLPGGRTCHARPQR